MSVPSDRYKSDQEWRCDRQKACLPTNVVSLLYQMRPSHHRRIENLIATRAPFETTAQKRADPSVGPTSTPSKPWQYRPCPDNKHCCIRTPSRSVRDADCSLPNRRASGLPSPTTNSIIVRALDGPPVSQT